MARRKVIYLELHPETAKGVAGGKAGGNGREKVATDTVSFATDTAKKTGQTERTARRKTSIGEKLGDIKAHDCRYINQVGKSLFEQNPVGYVKSHSGAK